MANEAQRSPLDRLVDIGVVEPPSLKVALLLSGRLLKIIDSPSTPLKDIFKVLGIRRFKFPFKTTSGMEPTNLL